MNSTRRQGLLGAHCMSMRMTGGAEHACPGCPLCSQVSLPCLPLHCRVASLEVPSSTSRERYVVVAADCDVPPAIRIRNQPSAAVGCNRLAQPLTGPAGPSALQ